MRFHVVSLPHTQTTKSFSACAYTAKVRGFCRMMMEAGHEVFLYAGEENDAPCTEHIPCMSAAERITAVGGGHYTSASFDYSKWHWVAFNQRAADAIRQRAQKTDFLCVIAGLAHKQVADALPGLTCVEFGVGYGGTFSNFRVYESYAWMHTSYGSRHPNDPHAVDGAWYDTVIPGYLDPDDFPFSAEKDDYFLYVGRLIDRKGYRIAIDACKKLGKRLVIAGPGELPADCGADCEYVGVVGPEERGRLMSRAKALFVPTIYVEPFGNVAIEAMACGTPVISTDWGAMTETVEHGKTGFRCRTFGEFLNAMDAVWALDPEYIRDRTIKNYSLRVVAEKYETYFERLLKLHGAGWYDTSDCKLPSKVIALGD